LVRIEVAKQKMCEARHRIGQSEISGKVRERRQLTRDVPMGRNLQWRRSLKPLAKDCYWD
jgi:hypothetical protein